MFHVEHSVVWLNCSTWNKASDGILLPLEHWGDFAFDMMFHVEHLWKTIR